MKKTVLILTIGGLISGVMLTGCDSPAQKVENAQNTVTEANKSLDKANADYQTDIDNYRKQTADKIAANNKSYADFKERMEKEKKNIKADNQKKLDAIEQKNSDLQKKMDDFKASTKENWEAFQSDFNRQMDGLAQDFKDLENK